jgi:aminopeptidase N
MKYLQIYGFIFSLLVASNFSLAQDFPAVTDGVYHHGRNTARTTIADPSEDNYDIKYLKFNLHMSNDTIALGGDVTTRAVVVASSFPAYVFELDSSLTIDSVLINGVNCPLSTAAVVRTVTLPTPLHSGDLFTAHVFYHGTPVTSASIFGGIGGINNVYSPTWRTRVTFTQSESYHASEWWPCKQSLRDKIDSVDMWITVPDSLKAGSNGLLTHTTRVDPTHLRFEWKERYPIDYYLISASVAPYIDYSYYMHFTGSYDSMLVQNYVYPNPFTLPFYKRVIDSTGMMIDYFSTLFSRYPFWKEKYGHCMAPLGGGMEHQTMTTLGYFQSTIVAHELGHQWFGDNATCGTWADIMMNEGFASYVEYLFLDHFNSHALATNDMRRRQDTVMDYTGGSIFCADTTYENRIFDSRLSYDKGACFLHMLRFAINNDSEFFYLFQSYQAEKKNKTGTIADFKTEAISIFGDWVNGVSLDTFFNEWAYQQGYPKYKVSWNQKGSDIYVKLDQATSMPSSVACFTTPMEIKLHSATKDTIVRILNYQPSQIFHFTWNNTMSSMVTDPNYWLVYKLTSLIHDTTLSTVSVAQLASILPIAIVPNPATTAWTANNLPSNCMLTLTDISGRTLWQGGNDQNTSMTIPADKLPKGFYVLHIIIDNRSVSNYKLIKD